MNSIHRSIDASGSKTSERRPTETASSLSPQVDQPSQVTSSLDIVETRKARWVPSVNLFGSFRSLLNAGSSLSLPRGSSLNTSVRSFAAKPTSESAKPLSPGVVKRNALIDYFCACDWSAELRAALGQEETRYFQTLKLAESVNEDEDEDDFPPYWDMIEKTSLLLDWLSAQPQEIQSGFFESYDSGFVAELESILGYSRGIRGVLPVNLLGDRWTTGEAPAGLSMDDIFLPPSPVSNAPRRLNSLHSSVVPGTEEVCSILATAQAHGVEKSKGGLGTLVNILIEGSIGPSNVFGMSQVCTGPMTRELDPSMSAGRHGPSYILMTPAFNQERPDTSGGISCSYHRAYLVPTSGEARSLEVALDQAAQMGMITPAHAKACKKKILTYDNILEPTSAPHPIAAQVLEDAEAPLEPQSMDSLLVIN